jgi:hypothetical protein
MKYEDMNKAQRIAQLEDMFCALQSSQFYSIADYCMDNDLEETYGLIEAFDKLYFQCESCNWWCHENEMKGDQICDDCVD